MENHFPTPRPGSHRLSDSWLFFFWNVQQRPTEHGKLVVEPYPSEKYEFVSWDDEIPNWMHKK